MSDWTVGSDPAELERQYGTQGRLRTRSGFWAPSAPGESPQDVALEALTTSGAREVHLSRHFDEVTTTLTTGRAIADHATAQAYLSTFAPHAAERLVPFAGTRTYTGSCAVLVAR